MVMKDIVLSSYYESDGLPQHESIEFCSCYPFPSDLQMLCNTEQLFFHGLWCVKRGAISLTSLKMWLSYKGVSNISPYLFITISKFPTVGKVGNFCWKIFSFFPTFPDYWNANPIATRSPFARRLAAPIGTYRRQKKLENTGPRGNISNFSNFARFSEFPKLEIFSN